MSFEAQIDTFKHKQIWCRSISALSAISESIHFTIKEDELSLSSVNASRTSHGEIIFKRSFFSQYEVDFSKVALEGFSKGDSAADLPPSYSFMINSKHLTALFRNFDSSNMKYAKLRIHWSDYSATSLKYKLLIDILNKKLILKKFQAGYLPITKKGIAIAKEYKNSFSEYENNKNQGTQRTHHIMIDMVIPKEFLEMVPTGAEDFKIDIKYEKVSFGGYTKEVIKDRDYIKQPMAVTVTMGLDELADSNLVNPEDPPMRMLLNFGMKDFKNFLNLAGVFANSSSTPQFDEEEYANLGNHSDYFHIYFRNPGDPILFDLQNNQHVDVQFIQITAGDNNQIDNVIEIDAQKLTRKLELEKPVARSPTEEAGEINADEDDYRQNSSPEPSLRFAFGKLPQNRRDKVQTNNMTQHQTASHIPSEMNDDVVTYNQGSLESAIRNDDTEYSDSEEEFNEPPLKRRLINEEEELGPTQVEKPESIF
ncbi:DDC1 [Candida theae]|uniref:DDC1 n=1 Tax=Candida theae TaxID=1198502 RepID=A0AAD5BFA1_9ASCO|nr:DDC1 [Candida theae]KAI5958353.1 DDC1 [Candida theae]